MPDLITEDELDDIPTRHPHPEALREIAAADPTFRAPPRGTTPTAELARRVADASAATPALQMRPEEVHAVLATLWTAVGHASCNRKWVTCEQFPKACEQRGHVERVLARLARAHGLTLPRVDPEAG